jgi:AmmeMemoRadiSam system protein B
MNKRRLSFIIVPILLLISFAYMPQAKAGEKDIRPSILAGAWYPGNKETLTNAVEGYLSKVKAGSFEGGLVALIVPHAGYRYSGQVAAHAYQRLRTGEFKTIIMIGPSHRVGFTGISVNLQSGYETPLGVVPVDQDLAREIVNTSSKIKWIPKAHNQEHSLEIQLPFLQRVLKDFRIVPVLMGQQDLKTCSHLAKSLVPIIENREKTLLLASTDLSHYHNYSQAKKLDSRFIQRVRDFDPDGLAESLSQGRCEACGGGPVVATMLAAKRLGASRSVILNYANSGDVTGEHGRVVGYLSAALVRDN